MTEGLPEIETVGATPARTAEDMAEWESIATAPRDGSPIRVSHEMDQDPEAVRMAYYADGTWVCENIAGVDGMIYRQPTIWLPDA